MDIHEIRRRNLRKIIEEQFDGSAAELTRQVDIDPSYISRIFIIKKSQHRRNIGNKIARKIEKACGKPHGWMDQPHGQSQPTEEGGPRLTKEAIKIAWQWLALPKAQRAAVKEMIAALARRKKK